MRHLNLAKRSTSAKLLGIERPVPWQIDPARIAEHGFVAAAPRHPLGIRIAQIPDPGLQAKAVFARSADQYHLCVVDARTDRGSAAATIIAAMTVIDQSFGVMPKARREKSRAAML